VKAFFNGDTMTGIGITCGFCHSTVDDSLTAGIGRRLDGWPNRDLDVGAIAAMSPTLAPMAELLKVPEDKVRAGPRQLGPGRYDAELNQDGKAVPARWQDRRDADPGGVRPRGRQSAHVHRAGDR
jgi:hypothetical protein